MMVLLLFAGKLSVSTIYRVLIDRPTPFNHLDTVSGHIHHPSSRLFFELLCPVAPTFPTETPICARIPTVDPVRGH